MDRTADAAAVPGVTADLPRSLPELARSAAGAGLVLTAAWCATRGAWSTLAALVMVVHCAYLLYVLLGGFLVVGRLAWLWPHLAAGGWGLLGAVRPRACPVTALEKWLLEQSGTGGYPGTFIGYYLDGTVWPTGYGQEVWLLTATTVLVSYAVALRSAARAHLRRRLIPL